MAAITLFAADAEGQVIVLGRARPLVGRLEAAALRAGAAPLPLGMYVAGRPLVILGPPPVFPWPGAGGAGGLSLRERVAARPVSPATTAHRASRGEYASQLPTEGQLRAMGDASLLNAIERLAAQLDRDLGRFDTADTWRRYFRLPEAAFGERSNDNQAVVASSSRAEMLRRFDSTVADPRYVQISGLTSFAALHDALDEAGRRTEVSPRGASVVERPLEPASLAGGASSPARRAAESAAEHSVLSLQMQRLRALPNGADAAEQPAGGAVPSEELPAPAPSLIAPHNGMVTD